MKSKESGFHTSALTILEIPQAFTHIDRREIQKVTPEMQDFFQEHLKQNNVTDAILTAVFQYINKGNKSIDFERLDEKMDLVINILNEKEASLLSKKHQLLNKREREDLQLEELLDEFGG